jgi:hypothetical protein
MATAYTHFSDLGKEVQPPDKGILSGTLHKDDRIKASPSASPRARSLPNTLPRRPPSCSSFRGR